MTFRLATPEEIERAKNPTDDDKALLRQPATFGTRRVAEPRRKGPLLRRLRRPQGDPPMTATGQDRRGGLGMDLTESIAPRSDQEKWLAVPGYEGSYEVSDLGRVRALTRPDALGRVRKGKLLSLRTQPSGHKTVALYAGRVRHDFLVHHLVLMGFVGPRPEGLDGCHWNDTPDDNRVENLRWDTRRANVLDSVRNGTHGMSSRTHCPQGHEYVPENTYWYPATAGYPAGRRACNECRRIYREQHQEERREKGREYMRRRRAEAKTRKAA